MSSQEQHSISSYSDNSSEKQNIKKKPIKSVKIPLKDVLKTVKERAYYADIDKYFTSKCSTNKINDMVNIINNNHIISLRLLNWFAMKYTATMKAITYINEEGENELFDVKISYRARLNTYSKKHFDPFRRNKKFDYNYDKSDPLKLVETTLCQLNFFKWLFQYNLLEYVEQHFDKLKDKIGIYNIQEKQNKEKKKIVVSKNTNTKHTDLQFKVKLCAEDDCSKVYITL
jgi:hypothetical protein